MGTLQCLLCPNPIFKDALACHLENEHRILTHQKLLIDLSELDKEGIFQTKSFVTKLLENIKSLSRTKELEIGMVDLDRRKKGGEDLRQDALSYIDSGDGMELLNPDNLPAFIYTGRRGRPRKLVEGMQDPHSDNRLTIEQNKLLTETSDGNSTKKELDQNVKDLLKDLSNPEDLPEEKPSDTGFELYQNVKELLDPDDPPESVNYMKMEMDKKETEKNPLINADVYSVSDTVIKPMIYTGKRGRPKKLMTGMVDPHQEERRRIEDRLKSERPGRTSLSSNEICHGERVFFNIDNNDNDDNKGEDVFLNPEDLILKEEFDNDEEWKKLSNAKLDDELNHEDNDIHELDEESSIVEGLTPEVIKKKKSPKMNREIEKKRPVYTLEEREWCVDMYEIHKGRKEGWIIYLEDMFKKQFPGRPIPTQQTFINNAKKMKKYNSLENRKKSGRKPKISNICEICGFVGKGKRLDSVMRLHFLYKHAEKKRCDDCGQMVTNLSRHKKTHIPENEKEFRCSICGKGFITNEKLNGHELIHGDLRPFPCQYNCGYSCKSKNNLRKHEIRCSANVQPNFLE